MTRETNFKKRYFETQDLFFKLVYGSQRLGCRVLNEASCHFNLLQRLGNGKGNLNCGSRKSQHSRLLLADADVSLGKYGHFLHNPTRMVHQATVETNCWDNISVHNWPHNNMEVIFFREERCQVERFGVADEQVGWQRYYRQQVNMRAPLGPQYTRKKPRNLFTDIYLMLLMIEETYKYSDRIPKEKPPYVTW